MSRYVHVSSLLSYVSLHDSNKITFRLLLSTEMQTNQYRDVPAVNFAVIEGKNIQFGEEFGQESVFSTFYRETAIFLLVYTENDKHAVKVCSF